MFLGGCLCGGSLQRGQCRFVGGWVVCECMRGYEGLGYVEI